MQLSLLPPPRAPDKPDTREPTVQRDPEVASAIPPVTKAVTRLAELPTPPPMLEDETPEDETPEDDAAQVRLSTARLMELARSANLSHASEPGRTLGSAPSRRAEAVADGPRAALGAALARSYAPATPEIVDRWLAADGSHQVVVRLPNGDSVCGRGEAWDPMRPLIEPVMLFRTCGGGGGRSFTMSADARPAYSVPD